MSNGTRTTRQAAPAPAASRPSPSRAAAPAGAASRLGSAPLVRLTPQPVGGTLSIGEVDLSSGQLVIPEATAAEAKPGRDLEVPVRLPGLAEGAIKVRKRGETFSTTGAGTAIRLSHPALAPLADQVPTVLVVVVKENVVTGWVGVGQPGPVRGTRRSLVDGMVRATEALGLLGMTRITVPRVVNEFTTGHINVAVENLGFRLGGYLEGTGSLKLDNQALQVEGGAKIEIPGGSGGELRVRRGSDGKLGGDLRISVAIGPASGAVVARLADGFVHVQGTVGYRSERMSGTITLISTDERTAKDLTTRTDLDPSALPVAQPGPDNPPKPGKRAFCGWGELSITLTPWLSGRARVLVNSQAQATIIGEVRPQKELILFPEKEWNKRLFRLEIRASYGVPVIGTVGVFANIGLEALAKVGPGKIHNMSATGQFSTDPRVENLFTLQGSLNISAFAGLRLRAEGGVVITILGHDLKAGVGLNALAGVRGYVDATPRIGRRMNAAGRPEWFIGGHMEIAAQPFLGFSGDLFVELDSPWWSPAPDKKWTWPLFSLEYPLPGEFGIGADVDYVLGSRTWPTIEFGEVDFDSSKFMTDLLADDVPKGGGGERRKPGTWREGTGGGAPGGARGGKGRGGRGESTESFDGPIGETMTFSDGKESHRLFIKEEARGTTPMMASREEAIDAKIAGWQANVKLMAAADVPTFNGLLPQIREGARALDTLTDEQKALKEAEKNAAATHKREGSKPRKRAGQNQRKKPSELKKRVNVAQATLKNLLARATRLVADDPFTPIKVSAPMQGGSEPVEVRQQAQAARLFVSGADESTAIIQVATAAPLASSFDRSGLNLVRATGIGVQQQARNIRPAAIIAGRINRRVRASLDRPVNEVVRLVGRIGSTMRIANLARAMRIQAVTPRRVTFKAEPKRYPPDSKYPGKAYRKLFREEMARQVQMQQAGINRFTVDRWLKNLTVFSMDERIYTKLDKGGRSAVLKELNERAAAALRRANENLARLEKRRQRLEAERALIQNVDFELEGLRVLLTQYVDADLLEVERRINLTNIKIELAEKNTDQLLKAQGTSDFMVVELNDQGETVRRPPRKDELRPIRDVRKTPSGRDRVRYYDLRIIGRQGAEHKFRDRIRKGFDPLAKSLPLWRKFSQLPKGFRDLAILHNPDQVAGGEDTFPKLDIPEGKDYKDESWQKFFDQMQQYVGLSIVNSHIGLQWKKDMSDQGLRMMELLKAESRPIWKNNFVFLMKPPAGAP
ncbi:hypothetical protein [Pyxidicoccus caerfyrddinensis]|uniref:hypothetical protein n=1 Tax=Pyxidicoccus caerfyrddinensis TaxID=2709663 RepID=UPI0013D9EA32|nr:hypothetical protein [Pyxidicoccus caerfyrddinensis]